MSFKQIKGDFEKIGIDDMANDELFRLWWLKLLFEINGNLDSLAVAARESREMFAEGLKIAAMNEGHWRKIADRAEGKQRDK